MARSPTAGQRRKFAALIASLEPRLRAAFEESVRNLKAGVRFPDLIRALEGGDVEAAIRALNIEPAAFYRYGAEKTAAFAEGGALTTTTINLGAGASIGIRFDMSNPGAERWIRENVANRVRDIANEQVAMIRETIQTGYAAGRGPREIGRDIAGRVVNGTRQGGVIGLDGPRARSLNAVTRGMESADGVRDLVVKGRDGKFRVRYKVNPATEKRILRAYNAGTAVPAADRAISVRQYENSLLKARGDTIARTETAQAVRGAQMESWQQVIDKGDVPAEAVIKRWIHTGGPADPRPHHVAANGMTVRGLNTPFVLANGRSLMYPHDPGADGSETINCTCSHEVFRDPAYGMEAESGPESTGTGAQTSPEIAAAEARKYVLKNGRKTGNEHLVAIDTQTGEVLARVSGGVDNVPIPEALRRRIEFGDNVIRGRKEWADFHHNHPGSTSLSLGDLIFAQNNGVRRIIAHGHDGSEYSGYVNFQAHSSFYDRYKNVNALLEKRLTREIKKSAVSLDDANAFYNHVINRTILELDQKSGFETRFFRYDYKLGSEMGPIVERNSDLIERIVSDIYNKLRRLTPEERFARTK